MIRALAAAGLVVAGMLASPWTAVASAGTYTWPLPTASTPSSFNPDYDSYGAAPWTYVELTTFPPMGPSAVGNLPTYSTTIDGGLTGWYDDTDQDMPFVAVDRGAATVGVVPPGQLALQPARDRLVGIGWTSPLDGSETISVSGTFTPDQAGNPICGASQPTWALEQDGSVIASGGGQSSISATTTIVPGDTVYLVVGASGVYSASCDTAGVTLTISAPSTPPNVTLTSPSAGERITDAQPLFSGRAATGFGDDRTVKVLVWPGASASGAPLEILSAQSTGGAYSVSPSPPLRSGTYTVRAEQDDAAGDAGFSAPVSFTLENHTPTITLRSAGRQPLASFTPRLEGTAGTAAGDSATVIVRVWAGSSAQGAPLRSLRALRAADGRWSVRVLPGLPNGRYVAIALQLGAAEIYGVSKPLALVVRVPVIAGVPSLSRAGRASVPIACTVPSGRCTGYVLVETARPMAPVYGGPRGLVRVLFGYLDAPAATTTNLARAVPAYLAAALRRAAPLRVRVSVALRGSDGRTIRASRVATLRLTR